jgi:phosphatidylserine/phosphatidylglycerophosphate/cardiolipin synthase-like enzyme
MRREAGGWGRGLGTCWLLSLCGCGSGALDAEHGALTREALGAPLVVSEVAQATFHAGSTADKVEVFCGSASSCAGFKVCDTAASGAACSALQSALAAGQRAVVSRGTSITTTDEVWLADASGVELPGTRVGPFPCASGNSRARLDCSLAGFGACGAPGLGTSAGACDPEDFPEDFAYEVLFTTNQHGAPESTCNRPVCQDLVALIDAATTSVDFSIYGVRAQDHVIDALVAAQGRGVAVRGTVDTEDSACTSFAYPDTSTLIASLAPGSVICDTGAGYSYIMHNKFFVLDGLKVWTGSTNLSDTELGGEYNSDVAATLTSRRLAAIYTTEFEEMFSGLFHNRKEDDTPHVLDGSKFSDGTTVVESYFSPTDGPVENAVIPFIDAATESLDIAMFFFTSEAIGAAVLAAKTRGVAVRLVIDAGGAANAYSQTPALCSAQIPVKWENWGGKSHSKWAVADAGVPGQAAVLFGSMNWTNAGAANNDENTLVVQNAGFAAEFQAEFERQWADLAAVPACSAVSAEGADSSSCASSGNCSVSCTSGSCCDGSDNDYDGHPDLTDEACGCSDGVDNDGDGFVDGADWECDAVDP